MDIFERLKELFSQNQGTISKRRNADDRRDALIENYKKVVEGLEGVIRERDKEIESLKESGYA